MSCDAYFLLLMKRAMARSDSELFGGRARYEDRARELAARLLSTEPPVAPADVVAEVST